MPVVRRSKIPFALLPRSCPSVVAVPSRSLNMLHLQMLVDDKRLALEWRVRDARVLVAAPDAAERTLMRKTTYPFRLSDQAHGHNPDSWKPLDGARRLFFVCGACCGAHGGSCASLVQAINAYKAARAKGRKKLQPGDGCASRSCAHRRYRNPSRFAACQRATAAAIVDGKYFLIRRPCLRAPKTVTLVKSADKLQSIEVARAAVA